MQGELIAERDRKIIVLKKERYIIFANAANQRPKTRKSLKVALSQKRLENFFVARINIPNHYPEQKIQISRLKQETTYSNSDLECFFGNDKILQYLLT